MADNTANPPVTLWLPAEIWGLIASFLDEHELALFRQVCQLFNRVGSDILYNRLRAIDNTLPPAADKNPLISLQEAFGKIQAKQQRFIDYLTQKEVIKTMITMKIHEDLRERSIEHVTLLLQDTSVSLKSLKDKYAILDNIMSPYADFILQPRYNELRDTTDEALLETAVKQTGISPLMLVQETFEKFQARQQEAKNPVNIEILAKQLAALHQGQLRNNNPSFSAYLPSFGLSNNAPNAQQEKPRDEEQMQEDNQMEQDDNSSANQEKEDKPDGRHRKTS